MLLKQPIAISPRSSTTRLTFPNRVNSFIEPLFLEKGRRFEVLYENHDVLIFILSGLTYLDIGNSKFLVHSNYIALCPNSTSFSLNPLSDNLNALLIVAPKETTTLRNRKFGVKHAIGIPIESMNSIPLRRLSGFYPISGVNVDLCSMANESFIPNSIDNYYFFLSKVKIPGALDISQRNANLTYLFLPKNIPLDLSHLSDAVKFLRIGLIHNPL